MRVGPTYAPRPNTHTDKLETGRSIILEKKRGLVEAAVKLVKLSAPPLSADLKARARSNFNQTKQQLASMVADYAMQCH